jgi:hypothetical protein
MYLLDKLSNQLLLTNSSLLHQSLINSSVSVANPEVRAVSFMRVKRVKLPNRSKTESTTPIES